MPSIIPQELYRDITSYLNHDHDSGTRALLCAAQCSWALRHEAQRVLFRNPFMFLWQDGDKQDNTGFSIIRSHEAFLEAILHASSRLGPLVRSYNQSKISYNRKEPGLRWPMWHTEVRKEQGGHIFELTEKALPHMTNLKSLYFATPDNLPTSPNILLRCDFQLEVMEWCNSGKNYAVARLLLPQQRKLRHLEAMRWDAREVGLKRISRNLVSVTGSLKDLTALARGRAIVAFEYHRVRRPTGGRPTRPTVVSCLRAKEAFRKLRYLRVPNYKTYLRLIGGSKPADVFPGLLLLEIAFWSFREISTYTLLPPNLQMLVLIRTSLSTPPEDIARSAFTAAPQLRFIDVGTVRQQGSGVIVHRYRKRQWGESGSEDADTGIPDRMTRETITFARGWGDDWWRERAASLGWIEGTRDMSYRYTCGRETVEPRTAPVM